MSKEKNIVYLRKYKDDIESISNEFEIESDEIEDIIDNFFISLKEAITDERIPTIKISNFGTFKPSLRRINWQIKFALKQLREGKGNRDVVVKKFRRLWQIRKRLMEESKGKETWKDWKDKKI